MNHNKKLTNFRQTTIFVSIFRQNSLFLSIEFEICFFLGEKKIRYESGMTNPKSTQIRILLTGASGYIGGRLLHQLESQQEFSVRCLARKPEFLRNRVASATEVVAGDVMEKSSLLRAMQGIDIAYYMIHSMGADEDFEKLDRVAAENFGEAAKLAGVKRIIYLGGLGDEQDDLSPHLRSRHEVGRILAQSGVQVIELRASIVIGSGSLSFEMIRALVERLPVMITPRWVSVMAQPIAISDLLAYLMQAIHVDVQGGYVFEIGGPERVSYHDLMQEYARQRQLKRYMIPVPVLSPRLSSLWLGLVTPLYARVGRKLVDSLRHPTIVRDESAAELFQVQPKHYSQAIADALNNEEREFAETRWSDAVSSAGAAKSWAGVKFRNRLIDHRRGQTKVCAELAFKPIQRIGGQNGWYYANWLWHLRGFLDLLVGGVGVRRGRRHPDELQVGDAIDWWRVESFVPGRKLRLSAEMKLPGRAWLEFEVEPSNGRSTIKQTAVFEPVGLAGLLYWYAVYPLHSLIFRGMVRRIVQSAERQALA